MGALIDKLKRLMCDRSHAGGRVKRDPSDCINWQRDASHCAAAIRARVQK